MAHYAKIGVGNIVTKVYVLSNEVLMKDGKEDEATGIEFLQNFLKFMISIKNTINFI